VAAPREVYGKALRSVSELFGAAAMEGVCPGRLATALAAIEEICAEISGAALRDTALLERALGTYPDGEGFVIPHSVNVATLATYVGCELGFRRPRLQDICLAGLTHDVGNVRLPDGILYKRGPLSPDEWEQLRERPLHSRDILAALGERYEPCSEIVAQVYERLDGSGYPRGLGGDEILLEARILGSVDFFETTIHPRPYKDASPGNASYGLQTLMRMVDQFGQDALKALVRCVGFFPTGSYVRLSTGEVARVLRASSGNPMRPAVSVVFDKRNRLLEDPREVDLAAAPHLYVTKPLSNSDLVELGVIEARASDDEQQDTGQPFPEDEVGAGGRPEPLEKPE
jgi:hypothetical protein